MNVTGKLGDDRFDQIDNDVHHKGSVLWCILKGNEASKIFFHRTWNVPAAVCSSPVGYSNNVVGESPYGYSEYG